jgi:hypothetical protein
VDPVAIFEQWFQTMSLEQQEVVVNHVETEYLGPSMLDGVTAGPAPRAGITRVGGVYAGPAPFRSACPTCRRPY